MNRKNAQLLFVVTILILTTLVVSPVSALKVGDPAPDFTLTDIDGNEFSVPDPQGRVVLLEFFVSTCPNCIKEVDDLKEVYDKYSQDLLVIISITKETNQTALQKFRDLYNIPWIIASDPDGKVHTLYNNAKPNPTIFIIDQDGKIHKIHTSYTSAETLISELEELGIPEFTAAVTLPLLIIVTLAAAVLGKKWSTRLRGSSVVE